MSITLPNVNLSALAVGASGSISLSGISGGGGIPYQTNDRATIRLHNDSGSGLRISLPKSGQQFNLPAGGWADCYPSPGETEIDYLVLYLLPNPPVSLLMATYYYPGEPVPAMTQLGNSPVGIGGTIQTSSVQTLSNEGNPANTLVIDIGDTSLSQLLKIFASGQTIWKVDQSGVAHQVLNIQISGNPLQLGQAGDVVEFLGQALVDQLLTAGAGITVTATGITISSGGLGVTGGTKTDTLTVTGSSSLASLTVTGTSSLDNGTVTTNGTGTVSLVGLTLSGIITFQDGSHLARLHTFTGTGSGTFNHNCGETPNNIQITTGPLGGSGSQTIGTYNWTATQVSVTTGAGLAWTGLSYVHG